MNKTLTVDESKEIQLEILKRIKDICIKNNLCYYLGYGTLLGAVRHKGFIPWDDDIDILMPRPDYIRFTRLVAKEKSFKFFNSENNPEYIYPFAKACDMNTVVSTEGISCRLKWGVWVDVFPIDGIGMTKQEGTAFFSKHTVLHGLTITATWDKYIKGRTDSIIKDLLRRVSYVLSRFVPQRKILDFYNRSISGLDYNTCKYVAVCSSPYQKKEIMRRDIYGTPKELEFEGEKFYVPNRYKEYLTLIYGDYMQLPPIEKRVKLHPATIYRVK